MASSTTNPAPVGRHGARISDLSPGRLKIEAETYHTPSALLKAHPGAETIIAYDGRLKLGTLIDAGRQGCFAFAPDGRNIGAYRGRREALRALPSPIGSRA
jgi:hypothetical protein